MQSNLFKGDHPDLAQSLNSLGVSYERLGDDNKALEKQKDLNPPLNSESKSTVLCPFLTSDYGHGVTIPLPNRYLDATRRYFKKGAVLKCPIAFFNQTFNCFI